MFKDKKKEDKDEKKKEKERAKAEKADKKADKKDNKDKDAKAMKSSRSYEEEKEGNTPPPTTSPISLSSPAPATPPNQPVQQTPTSPVISPRATPPQDSMPANHAVLQSPPPPQNSNPSTKPRSSSSPEDVEKPKGPAKTPAGDDQGVFLLKNKIANLPEGNRALVEYLITVFGKAVPSAWRPPANFEVPAIDDQIDVTLDKLIEASEILFNKDHGAMLKRYAKEFLDSPKRRAQKWRVLDNLLGNNEQFLDTFLSSSTLEASVRSALLKPLDDEEVDVLADFLQHLLLRDMANRELLEVIKACSRSNEHITTDVESGKNLADSIVELVTSFKKQTFEFPNEEIPKEAESRDKKDTEAAIASTNQSLSLLHHAMIIRHAKAGHDLSIPLEDFFQQQIVKEEETGRELEVNNKNAKSEMSGKLQDLDSSIERESAVLKDVLHEIKDLEAKLVQKRNEQQQLEETLAKQEEARKQYKAEQEGHIQEIVRKINESKTHLNHHGESEESLKSFSYSIGIILRKEVNDALKKTKEVLAELDKEVLFLEEKMASYERSYALFSGSEDEPEVLDGLRKLKVRSQAIFSESLTSVGRVQSVVGLLHNVVEDNGEEKAQIREIESSLDKIVSRQNSLNAKYQLQK